MKKAKKILTLVCCAVLLVCLSVGATLAYLSAQTNIVENTFTVGNVGFDDPSELGNALDEAAVNEYGELVNAAGKTEDELAEGETFTPADRVTSNTYKLIPNHTYTKDPTVHMSSTTEDAWLFVKVDNGIAAIEAAGDTTIAKQMEKLDWVAINADNGIYAWPTKVTKNQDIVVFNSFTLAGDADVAAYANAKITIQAYAVQADGLDSATAAWEAAPLAAWVPAVQG